MATTTRSPIEQLAEDLRENGLISVTYRDSTKQGHPVAQYTDFVGNCEFFGIEGIHSPRLVIRQGSWRKTDKPNLQIPLGDILAVEVSGHECRHPGRCDADNRPKAWWYAPFGGELQRHPA